MAEKNQWTQVFQGEYFLHVDYRDSKSLKNQTAREARSDADRVLADISDFPYPKRETIPNDFEFPPSSLEGQGDSSRLYQLQAIETNCSKLFEILNSVSGRTVTVEEEFEYLLRYVSDTDFRQYVDKSLRDAIEASQHQQVAVNISNNPEEREEVNDPDPEDLGSISSMIDSYRIGGYSSALDDMLQIVQQALVSSRSAKEEAHEVLKIAQQAQETAESSRELAAQLQAQIKKTRKRVDKFTSQAVNAAEKADSALEKVRDATDEAKNLIPNMLTILGIFVAIIIAVVGCYLSVLLNPPDGDATTVSLATYLLMGHILVNIIFLLLYFISKLTDRQIACYCHRADLANCGACTERCTWFSRMWIRYPVVVMLNSAFAVGYYILFFFQVVLSIYPEERILDWVQAAPERRGNLIAVLSVVLLIALSVVLLIILSVFAAMLHTAGTRQKKEAPSVSASAASSGTDGAPSSNSNAYAAVAEGGPGDGSGSDSDSGS